MPFPERHQDNCLLSCFPEDLAEKRLLHRAKLAPNRFSAMTAKSEQAQKAEGSESPAR